MLTDAGQDEYIMCKATEFGSRIKTLRQKLGWSLQQMASAAGVSKASQVGYERGLRVPDACYICRLAAEGVDAGYLIWGVEGQIVEAAVRWEVVATISECIESWSEHLGTGHLARDRRQWLLRHLYDLLRERSVIDTEEVNSMLALVSFGQGGAYTSLKK